MKNKTVVVHLVIINLLIREERLRSLMKILELLKKYIDNFTDENLKKSYRLSVNVLEAVDGVCQSLYELKCKYGVEVFNEWQTTIANVGFL